MDIRNTRELRSFAAQRVQACRTGKKIVLIYAAIVLGLSALVPVINYLLGLWIDQSGGLGNLGTRTVLSSLQNMLPIAMGVLTMCLDLGYLAAMLRVARGQYVSPQTLRLGFDRFWVMLRCQLLKMAIYFGVGMISLYLGILLFMLSPLSQEAVAVITPHLSGITDPTALLLDEAVYSQFMAAIVPAYVICGVLGLILGGPVFYAYRMTDYLIVDNPAMGALEAMRRSKAMMRGNKRYLLKLDLFQWKYYLAAAVASVLCYGDMILPMLGIILPGHEDVWYFAFLAIYLVAMFGVYYFLRNPMQTAQALAYDAVKPEEPKDNSVVLGNIFQM